ncbi:MAG: dTMP kinase [Candidatus Atribacteria bacterium]|nr:dTMP kinase [Candidatus Atribacteria bacterium]
MKKGYLITLEGFEGSGKTTIAQRLHQVFKDSGFPVFLTKEPGGTLAGNRIREILLERESEGLGFKAELLLFAASRSENVRINIKPALQKGSIVICDRYYDSTTAYQGYGRGIELETIQYLNHFAVEDVIPDTTFFLDVDPAVGLQRSALFNQGKEMRFEDEFINQKKINGKLFLERVRDGYYQIAQQEPERIQAIDANRDINLILNDIIKILNERLSVRFHKKLLPA